jgi:beta-phosphoglucomutase-like phosphatase (HAD superfamily)
MAPPALRGLLLDFDGTIADTERLGHRVAYNRAFAALGLGWEWDEPLYGDLLGVAGGKERIRHYLERFHPDMVEEAVASGLIPRIHQTKARLFAEIAPRIPLRPGVERLVREAKAAGILVAIATTAAGAGVEAVLAPSPLQPSGFDLIAADEQVAGKKPLPDVFLWAMDRLGLQASECVALEDSNNGLRAALAADLCTLVTVSDYTAGQDFTGAAAVLTSLGEAGEPAQVIAGPPPSGGVVDVAYLRSLLAAALR